MLLFFNLYMFYQIPHKRKALEPGGSSKTESNTSKTESKSGYYSEKTDKFYEKYGGKHRSKDSVSNKDKKSSGYYSEKTDKFNAKYDKKKTKDYDKVKSKSSNHYNPNLEPLGDRDFDVSR